MMKYEFERLTGLSVTMDYYIDINVLNADVSMDFHYDWIGDKEEWNIWNEIKLYKPENPLIVDDMNDYYKRFEENKINHSNVYVM